MKGWGASKTPQHDGERFTGETRITVTDNLGRVMYERYFSVAGFALADAACEAVWDAIIAMQKASE